MAPACCFQDGIIGIIICPDIAVPPGMKIGYITIQVAFKFLIVNLVIKCIDLLASFIDDLDPRGFFKGIGK